MKSEIDVSEHRKARRPIDPLFLNRWSPRAMSGEEVSEQDLMILFEAGLEAGFGRSDPCRGEVGI